MTAVRSLVKELKVRRRPLKKHYDFCRRIVNNYTEQPVWSTGKLVQHCLLGQVTEEADELGSGLS